PKPKGRGMELAPSPVEREARRFGLPVLTPKTLRTPEAEAEFRALGADCAVVVAYGLILPKSILDAVPLGAFNLHASLLPRCPGAAPINRAVMAGDPPTRGAAVEKGGRPHHPPPARHEREPSSPGAAPGRRRPPTAPA